MLAIDPTTRGVHELSDSPRAGAQSDNQAADIAVDPLAQYFYASSNLGTVTAYRLDATTAAFGGVDGSPYALQGMPYSVAIDPTGRFAYVGSDDARDDRHWALTARDGSPPGTGVQGGAGGTTLTGLKGESEQRADWDPTDPRCSPEGQR